MKLFVANGTRQVQDFSYRLPGDARPYSVKIPIGAQVRVPQDLSQSQLDSVVKHHRKYGMVHHSEVPKTKAFVGMCYNVDQPVPRRAIDNALHSNQDILVERGREMRKIAGIATHQSIDEMLKQQPGLGELGGVDMTVTEEPRPGQRIEGEPLKEGIYISKAVTEEESGKVSKRAKRRARSEA